jgi:hypothetical protein
MPRVALSPATRVIDSFEEITAQDIVDLQINNYCYLCPSKIHSIKLNNLKNE